jgi:tetratricopeptide (TPR) repeat protein
MSMAMKYRWILAGLMAAGLGGCAYQMSEDMYLKGQLEAERGHIPAALEHLSGAIKQNPRMGVAYIARGEIYKRQGNYEQAASDFQEAVKLEPYNFNANFQLGDVLQHLKRFAEAVVAYKRAVDIRPLDTDANMNLAMAYLQAGQPLLGLQYAKQAVKGEEDSPMAYANLGVLYGQIEDHGQSIDALKRSLELDSKQPEVYVNLAQEYLAQQEFDQAKNVLETARTLAPSPKVWDRLGYSYHMLRDEDKAVSAFQEALKLDPKFYPSLNGLGVVAMSRAVASSPADLNLAKQGIAYWNQSLEIKKDQPIIQELVNKYTPKQ